MSQRDRDCLYYDPFQGDETDVLGLKDRMLVTRVQHRCNICWDEIPKGTRVRAKTELNRETRQVMTFYFCVACCDAMALIPSDYGDAITARYEIGERAARV